MIEKILLGLAVLAIGIWTVPALAGSELPSPLKQHNSGTVIEDIQCDEQKILVESPSKRPACVNEDTAQKLQERNWRIISEKKTWLVDLTTNGLDSKEPFIKTITAQSTSPVFDDLSDLTGEAYGLNYPICILPTSISVDVPSRVSVDAPFDIIITPSFELTEEQLDQYNEQYETDFDDVSDLWENVCNFNRMYHVKSPANYVASGQNVTFITKNLDSHYYPPFDRYSYHHTGGLDINGDPTTIQMTISDSITNDTYKYDFGFFTVSPSTTAAYGLGGGVPIYTSINSDFVSLSKYPFVDGQSDEDAPRLDYGGWGGPITGFKETTPEDISYDVPYEWIVEELQEDYNSHYSAETFIHALGLNQTYAEGFFKAYPEYRTTRTQSFNPVLNWILPEVFGQSTPNLSFVNGKITVKNSDDTKSSVYGVNVCAYDVGDDSGSAQQIKNGQTPSCDITDSNGNFRILIPLTDLQGGSSTPDVLVKVIFNSDDFKITYYQYDVLSERIDRNLPQLTHSVFDMSDPRRNITGPFFNYGAFELTSTQHSSRAGYVLNSLQPVHDWYDNNVRYDPMKSTIRWTPEVCLGVGLEPQSNIMDVKEDRNIFGMPCNYVVYSALENPHTLRHEYAHQIQNQIYLDRNTTIDASDCNVPHSPVHSSGPRCAWTEGWASFMATAYDLNPVYQPTYMRGQWNFETRQNTEIVNPEYARKPFVAGDQEGNVASALFDVIDRTNEGSDNLQLGISDVWNAFNVQNRPVVRTIADFEGNWNSRGLPSLNDIFTHNTIVSTPDTAPPMTDPPTTTPTGDPVSSYSDDFDDLDGWILSGDGDWKTGNPKEDVPGENTRTNKAAKSADCDVQCILTLNNPLRATMPLTISFDRFIDDGVDGGEGLYVQYYRDGSWVTLASYTENNGQNTERWTGTSLTLNANRDVTNFRFVAQSSLITEIVEIDNLVIRVRPGGGGGNPSVPSDTTDPSITAPPDVRTEATGILTQVDIGSATATDNRDSNPTTTNNAPDSFPLGTTTITWTATDNAGNTDTDTQTITIQDTTKPVFASLPDDISIISAEPRQVGFDIPQATDIFPVTVSCSPADDSVFGFGTTEVTCTATDTSDNHTTISFTVTINPIPLTITAPPDITAEATAVMTTVDTGTATTNIISQITSDAPESFPLGTTTVTWTATNNAGNSASAVQTVTIRDTTKPVFPSPPGDAYYISAEPRVVGYKIPEATDIFPVTVSCSPGPRNLFPPGTTETTCTATDTSGNHATVSFSVIVTQTQLTITAPPDITAEATGILTPLDIGIAVTSLPADITTNAPDSFPLGTTRVWWIAAVLSDPVVVAFQTVTVQDTTPPTFDNIDDVTVSVSGNTATVNYDLLTASDLVDDDVNVTCFPRSGPSLHVGPYRITCYAFDDSHNYTRMSFYVNAQEDMDDSTQDRSTNLISSSYDSSLDGWSYREMPNDSGNRTYCSSINTNAYTLSHSGNNGGSALTDHTTKCWFGTAGGIHSFTPASEGSLAIDLDYRSLSQNTRNGGGHTNNMQLLLSDADGNVIHQETLFLGERPIGLRDTGWRSASITIDSISPDDCPCEVYVYLADSWSSDWRQQNYFDNFNMTLTSTVSGPSGAIGHSPDVPHPEHSLSTNEYFEMLFANGTKILVTEKSLFSDAVRLSWDPFNDATEYKVVVSPKSDPRDKTRFITDNTEFHLINLVPGTDYTVRIGEKARDETQSVLDVSVSADYVAFPSRILVEGFYTSPNTILLGWTDSNGVGNDRYMIERAVGDGSFEPTDLRPGADTSILDPILPDWVGKTIHYRVYETLDGQRLYSENAASVRVPSDLS